MEEEKTSIPSNEERLISLLSHLSIFFGGMYSAYSTVGNL